MGTNWFMPAFVKSRFGESGMSELLGTMVCCFSRKKSRNCWRIWVLVSMAYGAAKTAEKGAQATSDGAKVKRGHETWRQTGNAGLASPGILARGRRQGKGASMTSKIPRQEVLQWSVPGPGGSAGKGRGGVSSQSARFLRTHCAVMVFWIFAVFSLVFPAADLHAQNAGERTIQVVMDDNYPPYVFRDGEGVLQGICVDQWRAWEAKTGVRVAIHAMDWDVALRRMRAGDFDVADTIFKTPEREEVFDFTPPYARIQVPIFFRNTISGISTLDSLHGFSVAAKAGDHAADMLAEQGIAPVVLFKNYEAIITAAKERKVNVFVVDTPPALYFLTKLGIEGDFRMTAPIHIGEFHRAVRKGDAATLSLIERGFAEIGPEAMKEIEERWKGRPLGAPPYLRILGYGLLAGAVIIILLATWNWMLSREIRKRAHALEKSEANYRTLVESASDGILVSDFRGRLLDANAECCRIFGYEKEELLTLSNVDLVVAQDAERVAPEMERLRRGEITRSEWQCRRKDGTIVLCEASATVLPNGRLLGILRDVTRRKEVEKRLRHLNRVYAMLSGINETIVREKDETTMFEAACRIAIERGQFSMAWIGLREAQDGGLRIAAHAGAGENALKVLNLLISGPEPDCIFTSRAMQTGRPGVCNDIAEDPRTEEWRGHALRRNYLSMASLPLKSGGEVIGTFNLYADEAGFFDADEMRLLDELAVNVAFALDVQRNEQERERMEKELHRAEERFRLFMTHSPTIAWVKDDEGRHEYLSKTFEERFGVSLEQWRGKTDAEVWPAEVARQFRTNDLAVLRTGKAQVFMEETRNPDGAVCHWLNSKFSFRDGSGKRFVAGIGLDVTESRKTELTMRRLAAIVEFSDDAIIGKDRDGIITSWNRGAARIFGYEAREMIGAAAVRIIPASRQKEEEDMLARIAGGEHLANFETVRITRDGRELQVSVTASPILDAEGKIEGCASVTRDISGRKRIESRMRRLIESGVQGVIFWNKVGGVTDANDGFLKMSGYTREDLAQGRMNWMAMTPAEFAAQDDRAMQEVEATGTCMPFEKEFVRKDGTRVPVLIGAATFHDNPDEGVSFVLDLTERKKLEQQFLRTQRLESIGTLAAGIAHDLNNVLGPIMMSLELLRMRFSDPDSRDLIGAIEASARHGADLVRQVLSFGRGVEGVRQEVRIRFLISEIERIVNETFLKHVEVETFVPKDLWLVMGDPTRLHQVLLNLCVNARDAMPERGRLTISARNECIEEAGPNPDPEARPGAYVVLCVEDNGRGIPQDIVENIFDPFFTTKEVGKGTGLGLSTAIGIVKSHGGFIRVDSKLGRGTRFDVYLPAQVKAPSIELAKEETDLPPGCGECILIVDDEASVRQITQHTLEGFGYRVFVAENGADGLALYERHGREIHVVVTDMMMPVMDGPAMIAAICKSNPEARIIATSGLWADGEAEGTSRLGVTHFLFKPYTTSTLLQALRKVIAAR